MTIKANTKSATKKTRASSLKAPRIPGSTLMASPQYKVSYGPEETQGWLSYLIDLHVHASLEKTLATKPKKIVLGSARSLCKTLGIRKEVPLGRVLQALREMAHPMVTVTIPAGVGKGIMSEATRHLRRYEFELSGTGDEEQCSITISVHESYLCYLGDFEVRPLNPAYRQHLPPVAHPLYEWLSYRLYAAAFNGENRATFGYSDFCEYASLSQQNTLGQVQLQMKDLQQPLFDSGYLTDVQYESLSMTHGLADWKLTYHAGRAARRQFRKFRARGIRVTAPDPELYVAH